MADQSKSSVNGGGLYGVRERVDRFVRWDSGIGVAGRLIISIEGERDRMVTTEEVRWARVLTRGCPRVTEAMVSIAGVGEPVWVIEEGPALLVVCLGDSPWRVDKRARLMARVASV